MKKKKKGILSIVVVVMTLTAFYYFFGFQIGCLFYAQKAREPFMDAVPKPLNIESSA